MNATDEAALGSVPPGAGDGVFVCVYVCVERGGVHFKSVHGGSDIMTPIIIGVFPFTLKLSASTCSAAYCYDSKTGEMVKTPTFVTPPARTSSENDAEFEPERRSSLN